MRGKSDEMKGGKFEKYPELLIRAKDIIKQAQYEALKQVNKGLISMYWGLGKIIADSQIKGSHGKSIVEKMAVDLQKEFPGVSGFSSQNLWYMRQFYHEYSRLPNLQPLVGEISWTKHLIIMSRCKNHLEREFYIRMTKKYGWTKNVLVHQVDNGTYGKAMTGQKNFSKTLPAEIRDQARLAVKDEYTFDFLEMNGEHSERQLEDALISGMDDFLREMGGAFAYVGRQFRLEVSGKEYFIDILLYHRHLNCLVALELKTGEFMPEHSGKMQFYLTALDEKVKGKSEKPSIGIIICRSKDKTTVEYALRQTSKPIGVASYRVVKELPLNLKKELPAPGQIEKMLKNIR